MYMHIGDYNNRPVYYHMVYNKLYTLNGHGYQELNKSDRLELEKMGVVVTLDDIIKVVNVQYDKFGN